MQIEIQAAEWSTVIPALWVIAAALLVVGVDLLRDETSSRAPLVGLSMVGLLGAIGTLGWGLVTAKPAMVGFYGAMVLDDLTAVLSIAVCVAAALVLAFSAVDLERRDVDGGEYYGLLLLCTASMMFLVGSNDFIMVFLNLEILSLALYVLTGITRRNPRSNEAAVKYLVNGAFATGFLLFGMTLLYGATGTLSLPALGEALSGPDPASPLVATGAGLLLVGMAFKIGAVPFHMWVPDVYEGAPTSITAFMSVAVKAAGLGVLIRILLVSLAGRPELWVDLLWFMAIATMFVGNLLALHQDSVKRMLAYSSVAHTGYALVGLVALHGADGTWSTDGAAAVVFYMVVYTLMTLGAFAFLIYVGHTVEHPDRDRDEWQDAEHIDDLAGLASRRPWAAVGMTVLLVSLAGIPPTAGFFGKFFVFGAAVAQGYTTLAIIGVIASLVSLYYYLRPVVWMFMKEPIHTDELPARSVGWVVLATVVATLALGVQPSYLVTFAMRSVQLLG